MEPEQIIAIVISLMLLAIGVYTVSVITTTRDTSAVATMTDSFAVTNPTVDQSCEMTYSDLVDISVVHFNGLTESAVDSAFITYSGTVVTVASGGLSS